jgi:hypothetical protein
MYRYAALILLHQLYLLQRTVHLRPQDPGKGKERGVVLWKQISDKGVILFPKNLRDALK